MVRNDKDKCFVHGCNIKQIEEVVIVQVHRYQEN